MKTNYRVLLLVAVFGITLFTAAVNPHGSIYAVADRVEVNMAADDDLFAGLRWRNIGPFHGGRIAAVTGAIGQPGVFYIGAPAGGIWKTTSAGVTWSPIFDQFTNVDSVGAIQVAPSDPNIVYAGTGDSVQGSLGDGMYKSIDAGKTWKKVDTLPPYTGRISAAIAMHTKGQRVYVVGGPLQGGSGLYRSDDQGAT